MWCNNRASWGEQRGFTLIELLLALFMFSIIAATIFAAFSAISHGVEKGRQRTELSHIGRTAMQRLTRELTSAYLLQNSQCLEDKPSYFCKPLEGENDEADGVDRDRIMFLTIPVQRFPETVPRGEVCDVCYYIAKNDQGDAALFRSADCTLSAEKDDERCNEKNGLELTDAVIGLDVAFFGPEEEKPAETWPPDDADDGDETSLPCRVRVALTLRDAPRGESYMTTVSLPMRGPCEAAEESVEIPQVSNRRPGR
ncbi:MAG: prepilin-type N-terminal cleavage/methylation domain-containing protein [Candidatus Tectomicrobia bacterium]|nr:prepilin-type N-terminal cleavage/methylation domain-containing protein [Candidatus Tectomicrobia bacterium]